MAKYVCQLPQSQQDEIVQKCIEVFKSLSYKVDIDTEVENVLNSKVSDISDTIDISKYL